MHNRHFVLAATFLQNAVTIGFFYTFPRLVPAMVEEYDWSRTQAGLIVSVAIALFACLGMVTGLLIEQFGPKTIGSVGVLMVAVPIAASYLTKSWTFIIASCGVLPGIGVSFSYISAPATVGKLYEGKARALALTIVSIGNSVGAVGYAYLIEFLLQQYNLRGTLLVAGAIILNAFWIIMFWPRKQKPQRENIEIAVVHTPTQRRELEGSINNDAEHKDSRVSANSTPQRQENQVENTNFTEQQNITLSNKLGAFKSLIKNVNSIFNDIAFMLFAFGTVLVLISEVNIYAYMVDFIIDKSGDPSNGAFVLFLYSTLDIIGRVLPGFLKLLPKLSVTIVPLASAVLALAAKVLILVTEPVIFSMVGISVSGLSFGMQTTCLSVTTAKLIGFHNIPIGMGVMFTLYGAGGIFVGPLFGYIRDVTGSYVVPFQCSVGILVAYVILNGASFCARRRTRLVAQA